MTKNKNTKLFLAGTMALSSVVAVGLPAGQADAATITPADAADQLASQYFPLSDANKELLTAVQNAMSTNISSFITETPDDEIDTNLVRDLGALIKPPTKTTEEEIKEEALTRINTFLKNAQPYLSDEGDLQELFEFALTIQENLTTTLENTSGSSTLSKLSDALESGVATFRDNASPKVKNLLREPTDKEMEEIASSIFKELNPTGGNNGGGGALPTPEPPTTIPGGVATSPDTLENNPQDVIDAIEEATTVKELVVEATAGKPVTIPMTVATALENKNTDAVVVVSSTEASYELPVSVIDGAGLAKELGVASSELNITVEMTKIANQLQNEDSIGFAVEFSIQAVAPNGDSVDITYLGYPVKRSIETPAALTADTSVGVRINADGSFTAVPTYIDGKTANLYFSSNSAYTVIQNSKTFKDVDGRDFWAESYIEKLASKMIVNGKTSTVFAPDHSVTRGEFAALLARGLGLVAEDKNSADFTDVAPTQAVNRNGEISAVVEAGIVEGYGNGQFKPSNPITRSEAAIMISKAMTYIDSEEVTLDDDKKVADFKDYRYISATGRPHIEKVLQADYLDGFKDNTFRSENKTTRAEASKILYNFFNSIKFIN